MGLELTVQKAQLWLEIERDSDMWETLIHEIIKDEKNGSAHGKEPLHFAENVDSNDEDNVNVTPISQLQLCRACLLNLRILRLVQMSFWLQYIFEQPTAS